MPDVIQCLLLNFSLCLDTLFTLPLIWQITKLNLGQQLWQVLKDINPGPMTVEFVDMGIAHNSMFNGLFQKKKQMGWLRMWSFQGFQRNSMQNFQGLIKNKVGFPRVIKNHVEYPRVLSLGLAICKGLTQLCRISMGKALFCLEFTGVK